MWQRCASGCRVGRYCGGGCPLLRILHGRHGLPVGILDDLAGVFHAAAQRWDTSLKAFVDRSQADELFAEGRGVAQAEQHGMIVAVDLHVTGQKAAVAHDVVAVGVARGVELALAGDVPVGDGAGALEHHVGNHGSGEMLAGNIAVAGIVTVDEKARIGQADLVDYATREQATLKGQLVHSAVALGAQSHLAMGLGIPSERMSWYCQKKAPPSKSRREPWMTS